MIEADVLRRLERLNILAKSAITGTGIGRRLTRRAGSSQEFRDFRHYSSGDELRYLDWNIYARHGSLFVKEFSAEENIHIAVALDASASMQIGSPSKIEAVRQLGLALVYVGLCNFDSVSLYSFDRTLSSVRTLESGKGRIHDFVEAVEGLSAEKTGSIQEAFSRPIPRIKARTVMLLVSDFLDEGTPQALRSLLAQRIQVHMVQVLAPEEAEPRLKGRVLLRDSESGRERELYLSPGALGRYRERFNRYLEQLQHFAGQHEIRFARVMSPESLESMVVAVARSGILERSG